MVGRMWRGWTRREDADAYAAEDDRILVEHEDTVTHWQVED
jgi:hypothetical protein